MKVLRWQEASLETSKSFYWGSRFPLTVVTFHARKSMKMHKSHQNQWKSIKIYENQWKSMKIDGKRWKSSDDKKPAWNRAKVSIGAAGWTLRLLTSIPRNTWKSIKIYENPWKSMEIYKIYRKRWKSSDDKMPAWNRAKVSTGAASPTLRPPKHYTPKSWKSIKIH